MRSKNIKENMPVEQTSTLANSHQQKGNFQGALKGYQNILRINSSCSEAHNNLGKVYQELGQSEEAISCYQNAIRINADYADAHYNLGNLYRSLSECQQAIAWYQATLDLCDGALALNPSDDQVYTCLLYTSPSPRDGLLSRMPSSA